MCSCQICFYFPSSMMINLFPKPTIVWKALMFKVVIIQNREFIPQSRRKSNNFFEATYLDTVFPLWTLWPIYSAAGFVKIKCFVTFITFATKNKSNIYPLKAKTRGASSKSCKQRGCPGGARFFFFAAVGVIAWTFLTSPPPQPFVSISIRDTGQTSICQWNVSQLITPTRRI